MPKSAADRIAFPLLAALLVVAFTFGGGGARYALSNLVVQLAALGVAAVRYESFVRFLREAPLALRGLVAATFMLPILQVLPLPEPVWTALPGREAVIASLDAAADRGGWMSLSVDPRRTLLALTALVTPFAVLVAGWSLPRNRLIDLGWLVVALGVVTVLLGAVQIGTASEASTLYGSRAPGKILLGTFANRNTTGLFLGFALGFAALLPAPRAHPAVLFVRLAVCALLFLAVALTQSRTALVIALLPLLLGAARGLSAILRRQQDTPVPSKVLAGFGALALVVAGGGVALIAGTERVEAVLARFEAKDDPRRFIWEDAVYSAGKYWPAGAGMGVFDEIYQVDESLENLTLRRPGRAHNDYIELTIEAGAAGLILAASWIALIGWLAWRARSTPQRWAAWGAAAVPLAIAAQSVTDYPLRNQTVLAMTGFALLLLARCATDRRSAQQ